MEEKHFDMKKYNHLFWIIVGFVVSLMVMGMSATGSHSLTHSFQVGNVCDARNIAGVSVTTDESNSTTALYLPSRMFSINLEDAKGRWKFLYLNTDFLEKFIDTSVHLYNKKGKKICTLEDIRLTSGTNEINLPETDFANIYVEIIAPQNCTLFVNYAQIRESEMVEFHKKDFLLFAICLLVFSGIYCLSIKVGKKKRINLYKCIEVLQSIYIDIGNSLLWFPSKIPYKIKSLFRTMLIAFWMTYMMFMANIGKYTSDRYYKYHVIICVIIVLSLAILMLEKPLIHINWNKKIVYYWLGLSVIMCISEYVYAKRFVLTGHIFLIFFGFLYFIWNNMGEKDLFVKEIILSLKWTFPPAIIFSFIFRNKIEGCGYAGPTWNPNVFAMYLVPVIIALLAEIEEMIHQKKKIKLCIDFFLLDLAVAFNFLADSRIGILMMIIVFLFFTLHLKSDILNSRNLKTVIIMIVSIALLEIPVYITADWGVSNIPQKLGTSIEFPADDIKISNYNEVIASEDSKNNLVNNIVYAPEVTKILNGRNMYWMGYVRNLNFLGHKAFPKLWNRGRTAHNGVLAIAFQYGVLASIPYIFMFFSSIYLSFIVLKKRKSKYPFFIFGICVVSLGFMLVENFERPFLATEWILFYLILGSLFGIDVSR